MKQGDYDRTVGKHHETTLLIPDVVNFGSENWLDGHVERIIEPENSSEWDLRWDVFSR